MTRNPKHGRRPTPISPATSGPNSPPPSMPARLTLATPTPCGPCSRKTCCPATSTPGLGAAWIPARDIQAFAAELFRVDSVRRAGRPPAKGRRVEHRPRLRRQAVGRRNLRVRHRAGQRHMAPRIGAQHENPGDLRHDRQRRPRGTGGQPEADVGRPREAETHQGAVPLLGIQPILIAPSGSCGSTTTPTTTSGRGCSTARTSTSPA